MTRPIQVWQFEHAPENLKQHFYEDDADWLALIPKEYKDEYIPWLDVGTQFGCFQVERLLLENGDYVKVGYHS